MRRGSIGSASSLTRSDDSNGGAGNRVERSQRANFTGILDYLSRLEAIMFDGELRALVIAAIGRRPTSDTERIIAYAAKSGHSVSITEVNAVLEQLQREGYLSLAYPTRSDEVIIVSGNRLPQE